MPKHKGRYPDPAPKCLMNSLMCYERLNLFTFSWDTTLLGFPEHMSSIF